jgi:hypothetical protein
MASCNTLSTKTGTSMDYPVQFFVCMVHALSVFDNVAIGCIMYWKLLFR